jgi:hypothetical protein
MMKEVNSMIPRVEFVKFLAEKDINLFNKYENSLLEGVRNLILYNFLVLLT